VDNNAPLAQKGSIVGNRAVAYEVVGAANVTACVFNGEDGSEKGECVLKFELWTRESSVEMRSSCRAADLERLGQALLKAAADVRECEGK